MDNPETDSAGAPLTVDDAASLFGALDDPQAAAPGKDDEKRKERKEEPEASTKDDAAAASAEDEAATEDDPLVTVKVDGEERQIPLSELTKGYQLAQASTKRFEQAAAERKTAQAEMQKAQAEQAKATAERHAYAQNLVRMQAQIEGALQQQQQIDWAKLLETNPNEYLRQQLLANQRQAALQQNLSEQQRVAAAWQQEVQAQRQNHLNEEARILSDALPDWRDESKAKAEKSAIREYLSKNGYDSNTIDALANARDVLLARKAMLYDEMISKAALATKQVSRLPARLERPGTSESGEGIDRRGKAYQRLAQTGSVEDAAAVFAGLL